MDFSTICSVLPKTNFANRDRPLLGNRLLVLNRPEITTLALFAKSQAPLSAAYITAGSLAVQKKSVKLLVHNSPPAALLTTPHILKPPKVMTISFNAENIENVHASAKPSYRPG